MHILFQLFQTWLVTLRIQDKVFSENAGIVLVLCCSWKCVPIAISSGMDICKVPGCSLLQQISSQWKWQKLLQGLMSHELVTYFSVFNLFLTLWIITILSKGSKPDNFEPHNSLKCSLWIFETFMLFLLNVNLFLNKTLLRFLCSVRQTWATQLILAISLWGIIFL